MPRHPELRVVFATGDSQAGTALAELYPSLAAAYPGLVFDTYDPALLDRVDLVFCGLPHGTSQALMPELREKVKWVVDLAADFRLQDPALYPQWYGEDHTAPDLLPGFAYGLPELFRADITGATAVATPGCYPTAAALALAPLVRGRAGRDRRHRRRRRQRRVGRRAAGQAQHHASARSTRTSPPTACSPTATRRRWSRPSPAWPASTPPR